VIHVRAYFERPGVLDQIERLAFVMDGPCVFGHPAWLSAPPAMRRLKAINEVYTEDQWDGLLISGSRRRARSTHFDEMTDGTAGRPALARRTRTCC